LRKKNNTQNIFDDWDDWQGRYGSFSYISSEYPFMSFLLRYMFDNNDENSISMRHRRRHATSSLIRSSLTASVPRRRSLLRERDAGSHLAAVTLCERDAESHLAASTPPRAGLRIPHCRRRPPQKKSLSWYSSMTAYEAASGELRWIWAWIHKQRSTRWTWFV